MVGCRRGSWRRDFLGIRDRTGVRVVFDPMKNNFAWRILCAMIRAELGRNARPEEPLSHMPTGEIEVLGKELVILNGKTLRFSSMRIPRPARRSTALPLHGSETTGVQQRMQARARTSAVRSFLEGFWVSNACN